MKNNLSFFIALMSTISLGCITAVFANNPDLIIFLICLIMSAICCVGSWVLAVVQYISNKKKK